MQSPRSHSVGMAWGVLVGRGHHRWDLLAAGKYHEVFEKLLLFIQRSSCYSYFRSMKGLEIRHDPKSRILTFIFLDVSMLKALVSIDKQICKRYPIGPILNILFLMATVCSANAQNNIEKSFDVVIVGGSSGAFGAAIGAARSGVSVV